jgi:hypothetical protein
VFVSEYAIIDSLKLLEDKYLVTAGIDPKIRIWHIDNERILSEVQVHS